MKFEVNDLTKLWNALNKLAEKDFPLKTAIIIADNVKALQTPIDIIGKKERELIKKYAEKDKDGEMIEGENGSVKITNYMAFQREHDELFDDEIEVELKTIKMDELKDTSLTANDVNALRPIIKELRD